MSGPTINRGESSGDIWTPRIFIDAIESCFGRIMWDLAASAENTKGIAYISEEQDSLSYRWHQLGGLLYLNPPYGNIAKWAKKCAHEKVLGAEILLLVPRSGANWYWDWVEPFADVDCVGRMVFDNCFDKRGNTVTTPYPKDLILAHYHAGSPTRKEERWQWKQ